MGMNKVIWLVNGREGFGIARATASFAQEFAKAGIHLLFVSIAPGRMAKTLEQDGHRVICLDLEPPQVANGTVEAFIGQLHRTFTLSSQILYALKDLLRQHNADTFIYRSPNLTQIAALLPQRVVKCWIMPNVISDGYRWNLNKKITRTVCRFGGIHVIANSHYTASSIASPRFRPDVLHLGVDEKRFNPDLVTNPYHKEDFGFEPSDLVFGIFARLDPMKAQDLVIEALARLKTLRPDKTTKLFLLGVEAPESPYGRRCRQLVNELGLQHDVYFHPAVHDVERFYPVVDVVVNSRRDAEPFGLTVIEAMMMKKPVIALRLGGPAETIVDGTTGWLIDSPTSAAYADGLAKAVDAQEVFRKSGDMIRAHAVAHFSISASFKTLTRIIHGYSNELISTETMRHADG